MSAFFLVGEVLLVALSIIYVRLYEETIPRIIALGTVLCELVKLVYGIEALRNLAFLLFATLGWRWPIGPRLAHRGLWEALRRPRGRESDAM